MVLAREALLKAEEAGGRTIAVGTTVFSAAYVTVVLVD
jgi:S-adenosylmethionine:tRNA-ribosyltransferase-isomerase (queuine synthetase)